MMLQPAARNIEAADFAGNLAGRCFAASRQQNIQRRRFYGVKLNERPRDWQSLARAWFRFDSGRKHLFVYKSHIDCPAEKTTTPAWFFFIAAVLRR